MISVESAEKLGLLIRATRRSQRLRLDDLAGSAGVGPVFVRDVERGKPTVQLGRALKLLRELGIGLYVDPPTDVSAEMQRLEQKGIRRSPRRRRVTPSSP